MDSTRLAKEIKIGLFCLPFLVAIPFCTLTDNCNLIKDTLLRFTITLLSFLWIVSCCETRRIKLVYSPLNRPVLVFLGMIITWSFFAPYRYISFMELLLFASYVIFYFLLLNFIDDERKSEVFLRLLLVLFGIVCFYGILQYLGIDFINWETKGKLLSSFGNPDFFAGYLVLFLPVILALFLTIPKPLVKIGLAALFLSGIICLIGTLTRGAWLGFFTAIMVFAFLYLVSGRRKDHQKRLNQVLLLLAIVLFVFSVGITSRAVALRVRSIFDFGKDPSGAVRLVIWKAAAKAFLDRPVAGWGLGMFRIVFPKYRSPDWYKTGIGQYTNHAHNEYLEWLVDTGIIGLGVFLWVLIVFFRLTKTLRRSGNPRIQGLSLGIASGMAGLLTHNFFTVNLRWSACGFFFWLMIGLTAVLFRINDRARRNDVPVKNVPKPARPDYEHKIRPAAVFRYSLYFFLLALLILDARFETRQFLAEKDLQTGKSYLKAENYDTALNCLSSAVRLNPDLFSAYYQLGYVYNMKEMFREALATYKKLAFLHPDYARVSYNIGCVEMNIGDYNGALENFLQAAKLEDSPANHTKLAEVYMMLGNYQDMEKEYRTTVAIDPAYLPIYGVMATRYLKEGKFAEAQAEFKKITEKDPSSKDAHFNLGRLYENLQNWQGSIAEYKQVVALDPKDSRAYNNLGAIYLHLNMTDLALANLQKAVAINPKDVLAHLNLGRVFLKQGKRQDAALEFGKVIEMAPESWIAKEAAKFLAHPQ